MIMLGQSSSDPDFLQWQLWAVPAAGVLAAGVAILVGYLLLFRRRPVEAATALRAPQEASALPAPKEPTARRDPFLEGSASERRETVRRKGKHVKVLVANADATEELGWSWVLDRSMTGLCLKVDQPIDLGSIVSLRPLDAPDGTPWTQVEVKNCRADDVHWEVGCSFVRPPAWSVLLLFG